MYTNLILGVWHCPGLVALSCLRIFVELMSNDKLPIQAQARLLLFSDSRDSLFQKIILKGLK